MERLSGMDAFFLYAETPTNHMHVTLCAVVDPAGMSGGYSFERVRDHVRSRIHLVPPFTRRLVTVPLRLHHPLWIEDPSFDVDLHVRRAALPSPGSEIELAQLTEQIAGIPLDRSRPLWEIWVIEGLADDRVALVAKLHHSTLDGIAGVEQMVNFFDLEPSPAGEPTDAARVAAIGADPSSDEERRADEVPPAEDIPSDFDLMAHAAASRLRSLVDVVPLVQRTANSFLAVRRNRADPDTVSGATPLVCPDTPINGAISGHRRVAFARISLTDVKRAKQAAGATVNDVLLAVCAGALRTYLDKKGELPDDPLVAACPVNVRSEDQSGHSDNRISAMFTSLHTDISDPLRRLRAIRRTTGAAKEEHNIFGGDTLQKWAEVADPSMLTWLTNFYSSSALADRHRPAINVMVSSIPGPPFPLYLAGATLERAYPMGMIIDGVGLNITMMSYRDSVDFGFLGAGNLLPDVWDLADAVAPALADLLDALPPVAG
jgi:WS/DGAT/MGAT family acyltransferase